MRDKERAANIATGFIQPELGPRLTREVREIIVGVVPRNTGNVFSVRPKNMLYTAFHSFALWDPAS